MAMKLVVVCGAEIYGIRRSVHRLAGIGCVRFARRNSSLNIQDGEGGYSQRTVVTIFYK